MNEKPFISIKAALPDVFNTIDELNFAVSDVLEWSAKAMAMMNIYEFSEEAICFRPIQNYRGTLPCGLLQINQILYKTNYKLVQEDITHCKCEDDVYSDFADKYLIRDSSYIKSNWSPLRASTNNFMLSVLCENSPNLLTNCEQEFTILPTGTIATSFKEGWVMISYLKSPLDKDNLPLIPDNQELFEGLRYYIMLRIWEKRWNMKEEGSRERFEYYNSKWGLFKNMIRGSFKLPTAEQRQNIIDQSTSLLPQRDRYYTYFGNLSAGDTTFF